jgi:microcystin degradation protein MlrC
LCCWAKDVDRRALEQLRADAKADLVAASPAEALMFCIDGASKIDGDPDDRSETQIVIETA